MKIIKATWEKRNLGCEAYEISLDRRDLKDVDAVMHELHAQDFSGAYVLIKMPVGNLNMLHALEDDGFRFMETQLYLVDHFTPLESQEQIQEWMHGGERMCVPKTRECWDRIISRITPGMFDTDRICLDPKFGKEFACIRYQNWCRDLFDNPNSWMWVLSMDGEEVSFGINVRDEKKNVDDGVLGGVFERFKGMGYGIFQILDLKKTQVKNKTVVSSNNQNMLRVYQNYGRIIYKEMYVLRKIFTGKEC